MTKDELIEYLIKAKKVLQIGEQYYPIEKGTNFKTTCKNFPDKYKGVSIKQMYTYFIQDAEIPLSSNGSFVYLLHTRSKEAENVLKMEILENPSIDYLQLIQNIKKYYMEQNTVKYPVSKLLTAGLWKGLYENKVSVKPSNIQMR